MPTPCKEGGRTVLRNSVVIKEWNALQAHKERSEVANKGCLALKNQTNGRICWKDCLGPSLSKAQRWLSKALNESKIDQTRRT